MKHNLLFILFVFSSVFAFGQVSMTPEEVSIDFEFVSDEDQTIILNALMVNGSDESVTYNWTKEILAGPRDWEVSFCDKTRCWLSFVDQGSVQLEPGEEGTADVHLETFGHGAFGDSCVVRMTISEDGNPSNTAQATYRFYAMNSTSVNDLDGDTELVLFPNPTTDFFQIKSRVEIGQVSLFDFVGREVRNFKANHDGNYNLDGLRSGMYLARIYNEKGQIIRTIRLHKR